MDKTSLSQPARLKSYSISIAKLTSPHSNAPFTTSSFPLLDVTKDAPNAC